MSDRQASPAGSGRAVYGPWLLMTLECPIVASFVTPQFQDTKNPAVTGLYRRKLTGHVLGGESFRLAKEKLQLLSLGTTEYDYQFLIILRKSSL